MKLTLNVVLAILLLVFSSFKIYSKNSEKIVIVLDAGHGGDDNGSLQNSISEKDYTLEIVKLVKTKNKNANVEIILTREDDKMVALADRSALINQINPDFFISIHLNKSSNPELKGNEIFIKNFNQTTTKTIAEEFYNNINNPLHKRGIKEGNFHLLRETNSPGFIYEVGFISNQEDYTYLTSDAGKHKIAEEIIKFIQLQ